MADCAVPIAETVLLSPSPWTRRPNAWSHVGCDPCPSLCLPCPIHPLSHAVMPCPLINEFDPSFRGVPAIWGARGECDRISGCVFVLAFMVTYIPILCRRHSVYLFITPRLPGWSTRVRGRWLNFLGVFDSGWWRSKVGGFQTPAGRGWWDEGKHHPRACY